MALTGATNEERIWNFCISKGMTKCGASGLMGNIYAESGLSSTNLQNSFEKKVGYTDASYTSGVDAGIQTSCVIVLDTDYASGLIGAENRHCLNFAIQKEHLLAI
jgi:hypothetical protein